MILFEKIKASRKFEQILQNFIDVLRINLLIVDGHGNPVLVPKANGYGFQGSAQWGILKRLGTPEFLSRFETEGDYQKSVDAFGFQSFAIPIPIPGADMDDFGYLIVGPVVVNKQFELSLYEAIAQGEGVDFPEFLNTLAEVRVITFNTLKSTLDLLADLSRYALHMGPEPK